MAEFITSSLTKAGLFPDLSQINQERLKKGPGSSLSRRYMKSRYHQMQERKVEEKDYLHDTLSINPIQNLKGKPRSILTKKFDENQQINSQYASQSDIMLNNNNNPFAIRPLNSTRTSLQQPSNPNSQPTTQDNSPDNSLIIQSEIDSSRSLDNNLNSDQKTDFKDILKMDSIMKHRQENHMEADFSQLNGSSIINDSSQMNDISYEENRLKQNNVMELDQLQINIEDKYVAQESSDERILQPSTEQQEEIELQKIQSFEEKFNIQYYYTELRKDDKSPLKQQKKQKKRNDSQEDLNSKVKFRQDVKIYIVENWKQETKENNFNRRIRFNNNNSGQKNLTYREQRQFQNFKNGKSDQYKLKAEKQQGNGYYSKFKKTFKKYLRACCECKFM